jgi:alkylated DNA repair dioxygenase AlkB
MIFEEIQNGEIGFIPNWLTEVEANHYYQLFQKELPFEQGRITIFGKTHPIPRLEAFFGISTQIYSYSGKTLKTNPFTKELFEMKTKIEETTNEKFNCVLVNLYRDGRDSNGWHADNEPELGINPTITSLTLGAMRRFDLRHNTSREKISMELNHGSLLVMKGGMQHFWKHQIAKTTKVSTPRINLTFRYIY